jgi:hypothetical protein
MIIKIFLFLLISISFNAFADDTSCLINSGRLVQSISFDVNGDGIKDNIKLIKNLKKGCVVKKAFSPWTDGTEKKDITLRSSAIIIATKNKMHILYDDENPSILDTSAIDKITTVPRSIISKEVSDLKAAKGDVIIIPTESGIDSYLYWNGNRYQSLFPNEEP